MDLPGLKHYIQYSPLMETIHTKHSFIKFVFLKYFFLKIFCKGHPFFSFLSMFGPKQYRNISQSLITTPLLLFLFASDYLISRGKAVWKRNWAHQEPKKLAVLRFILLQYSLVTSKFFSSYEKWTVMLFWWNYQIMTYCSVVWWSEMYFEKKMHQKLFPNPFNFKNSDFCKLLRLCAISVLHFAKFDFCL